MPIKRSTKTPMAARDAGSRADPEPATPVAAAGHRVYCLAVDLDVRRSVSVPRPPVRRPDGIHYQLFEEFR